MGIGNCDQGALVVSLHTITGVDAESDDEAVKALAKSYGTATEEDLCVSQGNYFVPVDGQAIEETDTWVKDHLVLKAEGQEKILETQNKIKNTQSEMKRLKPPSTLSTLQRGGQGFLGGVASAWGLFGIGVPLVKRIYSTSCDDGSHRVAWKHPLAPVVSMAVFTGGLWVVDHVFGEEGEPVILGGTMGTSEDTSDPFASIPTDPEGLWKLKVQLHADVYDPGGIAAQRIRYANEFTGLDQQLTPLRESWANASWFTQHAPELIGGSAGTVFGFATTDYIERGGGKFFKMLENRGLLKPCRVVPEQKLDQVPVDAPAEHRVYEESAPKEDIGLEEDPIPYEMRSPLEFEGDEGYEAYEAGPKEVPRDAILGMLLVAALFLGPEVLLAAPEAAAVGSASATLEGATVTGIGITPWAMGMAAGFGGIFYMPGLRVGKPPPSQ